MNAARPLGGPGRTQNTLLPQQGTRPMPSVPLQGTSRGVTNMLDSPGPGAIRLAIDLGRVIAVNHCKVPLAADIAT